MKLYWQNRRIFDLGLLAIGMFRLSFVPRSVTAEEFSLPSKSESLFLRAQGAIGDKLKKEVAGWKPGGGIPNNPDVSGRLFCATSSVQQLAAGKDLRTDHAKCLPGLAAELGNRTDRYFLQELGS